MYDFKAFAAELRSSDCDVITDAPMREHTTFRAGGSAPVIVMPKTLEALQKTAEKIRRNGLDFIVIGNGSNILVKDSGIDKIVIKTTSLNNEINVDGDKISCTAGTSLAKLCMAAYENSLSGLEFAYGIPGTVGGAVYMNAGAYGGEIKDVLCASYHISPCCSIEKFSGEKLMLSYRKSFYSLNDGYIIIKGEFKLARGNKEEIKAKMDDFISRRKDKQPLEYPSAGSTFKRPEGHFAGALIEQCGLKGFSVGGAEVSEKHAGFIINKNNGSAADILALIDYVKKTVKEKTGVDLEPEVKIIP